MKQPDGVAVVGVFLKVSDRHSVFVYFLYFPSFTIFSLNYIILQENILSDAQAEVMNVFEPFRFRALLHSEQTSSSIHDTSGT